MTSTTCVAARLAITGFIDIDLYYRSLSKLRSNRAKEGNCRPRFVGRLRTIVVVLAADEAASMLLSDDTDAPSTPREHFRYRLHYCVWASSRDDFRPARKLHQDTPGR
jgi:hypothetical protein